MARLLAVFGVLSLLGCGAASAQEAGKFGTSLESEFHFGIVGASNFKERADMGTVHADDWGTRDVVSMKVSEAFLIRFGMEWQRRDFSVPHFASIPTKLQMSTLVVGADLQLGDAWIVRVEVQPGFYSGGTNLREKNFQAPVIVGASYFVSSDLQFVAGISIDPDRKYPVLPGIGFRYRCATDWVLDFILPTPRIEYNFSKSLLLYVGGDFQGETYRVDGDFGTARGVPKLNDAVVDYSQIRVGAGASWKIGSNLTLEMEAGFVPVQEFDFHRADVKTRATDTPPYGAVQLKAAF